MDATTGRAADAFDGEARRWLEVALGASRGGDLADALANAPSAAVARHLRRLLAAIVRGDPASDARLRTTLFAMPVILVAALEKGAQPVTLTGAIATAALAGALRDARAFGGCETFALSTSLVATSALDIAALPALLATARMAECAGESMSAALDLSPAPCSPRRASIRCANRTSVVGASRFRRR